MQLPGRNEVIERQDSVGTDGWGQVDDTPAWPLKSCSFKSTFGITVTPRWMRVSGLGFTLPCTFSHHLRWWSVTVKHYYLHLDMQVPFAQWEWLHQVQLWRGLCHQKSCLCLDYLLWLERENFTSQVSLFSAEAIYTDNRNPLKFAITKFILFCWLYHSQAFLAHIS